MPGSVHLREEAANDLNSLAEFTLERFGAKKAAAYRDGVLDAFDLLLKFPLAGSDQSALRPGLRRYIHASHAIYYRIDGDDIIVSRILGPGQDPIVEDPIVEFGDET